MMSNQTIGLTDSAIAKCSELISREGRDDLRLRVSVQPGGCSGLIYSLYFDTELAEEDVISDYTSVEVVVDKMSLPYIEGAVIDYEDTIEKQGFVIDNPNAQGTCACGDSFN